MKNEKKSSNKTWLIVVLILIIAILGGGVLLVSNLTNFPGSSESQNVPGSSAGNDVQDPFLDPMSQVDMPTKPVDKLIIKTVNFDRDGNISQVLLFSPPNLREGTIVVEGFDVEVQRSQQGDAFVMDFLIPDASLKKDVTFQIQKDGNILATCSLTFRETIAASGDCVF